MGLSNRSWSCAIATFALLAAGACSSVATPVADSGLGGARGASPCPHAGDAAIQVPDTGNGWCGGEISVSGSTPLGPFCPTQIRASIGASICFGSLSVGMADGAGVLSNQMLILSGLSFDSTQGSWVATRPLYASLSSNQYGQAQVFPVTIEIIASDEPYPADAGPSTLSPLTGGVHLRFSMQSSAGLLSGTVFAKYCEWVPCLP